MVYQISSITRGINCESTSGGTIRKLPLTNRSGSGVLDNPRYAVSEKLRIIQFAMQSGNRATERGFGVSDCSVRLSRKSKENLEKMHISMIHVVKCSLFTLIKLIWHDSSILRVYNILRALSD